jgi:predicted nucleic acid-binding protein
MTTVCNASPLVGLSTIGALDLLHSLFGTIHIADFVHEEVVVRGQMRPGAQEVATAGWIIRHTVTNQPAVAHLMSAAGLDQGESETIILADELHATLTILDERKARRQAHAKRLAVTGTLGVLLLAKTQQLIPSVKQPLDALIAAGFRVAARTYRDALGKAGE